MGYGTLRIGGENSDHAVLVLHGIRQKREDLRPFAEMVQPHLGPRTELHLYGYNHTLALEANGAELARIVTELGKRRVDLIGYSMGGLVARLAASERPDSPIHTVVTVATPNRGSLGNAELTWLGQLGRDALDTISPLIPRTRGVKDLTRVPEIMKGRWERLSAELKGRELTATERRYASIPALFYHADRRSYELGPSAGMSTVQAVRSLVGLRVKLTVMLRAHDGIVSERSNDISVSASHEFTEVDLTRDEGDLPARCHAFVHTCREHDHSSILSDSLVARLAAALVTTDNWRNVRQDNADLLHTARLKPFAAD